MANSLQASHEGPYAKVCAYSHITCKTFLSPEAALDSNSVWKGGALLGEGLLGNQGEAGREQISSPGVFLFALSFYMTQHLTVTNLIFIENLDTLLSSSFLFLY